MAIDSAEKRRNVAALLPTFAVGVTPNAAPDAEWRAQAGWGYSGFSATPPIPGGAVMQPMFLRTPGRLIN
jgi:hypothetical protein